QSFLEAVSFDIKHAPKIFTETCRIDWSKPAADVHNLVRGLSPYPGAFTSFEGKTLKIYKSLKEEKTPAIEAGEWDSDKKTYLKFACADGYISVTELQLEGKKKMTTEEFLRGYRFS
ncbi:MAG TPA: methionyl-tRNA formyltransferase, partial [Flavisolibacter sp.]|nr:methionyl-tRNA formyltransferase [Flavisolibacter sp.]